MPSSDDSTKRLKARLRLNEIGRRLEMGDVTDERSLVRETLAALDDVLSEDDASSIRPPVMRVGDILFRRFVVEPLSALDDDLRRLRLILDQLGESFKDTWSLIAAEMDGIRRLKSEVLDAYDAVLLSSAEKDPGLLWAMETFRTRRNAEELLTTAHIDERFGVLTLAVGAEEDIASRAQLKIVPKTAIGVPGCNALVRSLKLDPNVDTSKEPEVTLVGDTEPTIQPINVVDGNPNTRFEWEVNVIPRVQPVVRHGTAYVTDYSGKDTDLLLGVTKGYGLRMGIAWTEDEIDRGHDGKGYKVFYLQGADGKDQDGEPVPGEAACELQLIFPQAYPVSAITIQPGWTSGGPVYVDRVNISSDNVSWSRLTTQPVALTAEVRDINAGYASRVEPSLVKGSGAAFWVSPPGTEESLGVAGISFVLRHSSSLSQPVRLAHKYYARIEQLKTTRKYVGLIKRTSYETRVTREPGPDVAAVLYGTSTSAVAKAVAGWVAFGPAGAFVSQLPVIGKAFEAIGSFVYSKTVEVVSSEVIEGHDVFLGTRHAVSIRDIQVLVRNYSDKSVYVSKPHVFSAPVRSVVLTALDETPSGFGEGRWIRYFISHDGKEWVECQKDKSTSVPVTDRIYVKIELERPAGQPNLTPVVYSYALAAVPADTAVGG